MTATFGAPGSASAAEPDPYITVSHIAGPGGAQCLPTREAATATTTNTDEYFALVITATAPLCVPVSAVVYAMPDNVFYPWPQTRVEVTTFDVEPGVTTVRFAKGCDPVQFDVVTGRTPDRIQPSTGPMHGPLLFEWFPWSALQHWGGNCGSATTTTTTSTTTTSTTTTTTIAGQTTTTVENVVQGTTTIVGPTTTRPAPVVPKVESATTVPRSASSGPSSVGLAVTGGSGQGSVFLAGSFILAGMALLRMRRVLGPARSPFAPQGSPFATGGTEPDADDTNSD